MTRTTYSNKGWTKLGKTRKKQACETHRCAYCNSHLGKHKKFYCDDTCQNSFWTDIRYHLEILDWSDVRLRVLMRDNYTCQNCGKTNSDKPHSSFNPLKTPVTSPIINFDVHHITPISQGGKEFDYSNLITLCNECHKKHHALTKKDELQDSRNLHEKQRIFEKIQKIEDEKLKHISLDVFS